MELEKIGYNHEHDRSWRMDVKKEWSWWLFLLIKTPALFRYEDSEEEIVTKPNSYILFSYGTEQHYRAYGDTYTDDWFHLRIDNDDIEFLKSLGIITNRVIELPDANEISMLIRSMAYEFHSDNKFRTQILESSLNILFLKLSRQINSAETISSPLNSQKYDELLKTRSDIYAQPQLPWSIDDISQRMSVSRSTLQHTYKKIFGVSISGDIIAARIRRARYYLTSTGLTVAQIADECGYNSDVFFMRQFKQIVGKSPTEYRNKV